MWDTGTVEEIHAKVTQVLTEGKMGSASFQLQSLPAFVTKSSGLAAGAGTSGSAGCAEPYRFPHERTPFPVPCTEA